MMTLAFGYPGIMIGADDDDGYSSGDSLIQDCCDGCGGSATC